MTSECENREPVYTQTLDNMLKVDDDKMDDLLLERTWRAHTEAAITNRIDVSVPI